MYDCETSSRLTSIRKKSVSVARKKIGEIKKRQGRRRGEWSRYFSGGRLFYGILYSPARSTNERNPYRIKASICTLLFLGGVRAQLTSLRESRLTCFATIIQPFRIHFSFPPNLRLHPVPMVCEN